MITSGLEDYLEYIYNSISIGKNLKAIDIANHFKVSRASVSEALIRLSDIDLIVYEGRKGIKITESGISEAKKIINKHNILCDFLCDILKLDFETSSKNACKIEHVIDDDVIVRMQNYINFCQKNDINNKFTGENQK